MALLTEIGLRSARTRERPYKLFDESGLFLLVTPAGGRLWRFRYKFGAIEKLIGLGAYPETTLKQAREHRDEARKVLANGDDPSFARQARRLELAVSFEGVAMEWLALQSKTLAPGTISMLTSRLNSCLFPYIGSRPIASLTAQELLFALRRIEVRGCRGDCAPRPSGGRPRASLCRRNRARTT